MKPAAQTEYGRSPGCPRGGGLCMQNRLRQRCKRIHSSTLRFRLRDPNGGKSERAPRRSASTCPRLAGRPSPPASLFFFAYFDRKTRNRIFRAKSKDRGGCSESDSRPFGTGTEFSGQKVGHGLTYCNSFFYRPPFCHFSFQSVPPVLLRPVSFPSSPLALVTEAWILWSRRLDQHGCLSPSPASARIGKSLLLSCTGAEEIHREDRA